MTSAPASRHAGDGPERPGLAARLWRWLDDGRIMQIVFYGLLAGAVVMLWRDFDTLVGRQALAPAADQPLVLPAVERPEIDPDAPRFSPRERVSAPDETLTQPMTATLQTGAVLALTGTIDPGAADRFASEISARGEYVETVALNSPGGSVADALAIAALIRERGYATRVGNGDFCASSCPLIFAGGTERLAGDKAVIGVHQVFAAANARPGPDQAMSDAQITTARIARHLDEMGVAADVWVHALETPPDMLYYFSPDELIEFELATEINP